jgi:DNA-binding SARP family transcriptional activator/TolB-like protein
MINLPIVRMSLGYSPSISMIGYGRWAIVGVGVETRVESALFDPNDRKSGIRIGMLGPLTIASNGATLALPASRKLRALVAYLAMAPNPVGRSRLCELLWDGPNDPRGELRWCLSKIRKLLDGPDRRRVTTSGDRVALDLTDCFCDVFEVAAAAKEGFERLDARRLEALSALFVGEFLAEVEINRSPQFESWLISQRRRFLSLRIALLERLAGSLSPESDEVLRLLEDWIELAPFDERAHENLLATLARRGQFAACDGHLAATARHFEAEDCDFTPIRKAWRLIKEGRVGALQGVAPISGTGSAIGVSETAAASGRRSSLAVMPFLEESEWRGGLADGLTHDIITRLAKLRSLFVIARGSVFALAEQSTTPEEAGRRLNVDYVASGSVRRQRGRIVVTIELVEARTSRIVWTEVFDHKSDDTFIVLDEIGNRIVSSIASEIEAAERNHAILKSPNSLNAWEAYHRGLWHMYRFTRTDNDLAQNFFQTAVRLDPTFSRAHASLSFTHWQNAFQQWADRDAERDLAYAAAGQSLIVDDRDPAAHWAMGRALWLRGRQDESLAELERAVDLSPNFALGHYSLSFVHSQSGDPNAAIASADHSLRLSPFDPLLFGMLGARAFAHVRLGQFEEAAEWALKAAARPNAHAHILAIAAHCLALTGRIEEGQAFTASIRRMLPRYCSEDFLTTFRFAPDAAALFRVAAGRVGLA